MAKLSDEQVKILEDMQGFITHAVERSKKGDRIGQDRITFLWILANLSHDIEQLMEDPVDPHSVLRTKGYSTL